MAEQQAQMKKEWENLVGKTFEEAKKAILACNCNLKVEEVKKGSAVTRDFCMDRVRVFMDDHGKVESQPKIG